MKREDKVGGQAVREEKNCDSCILSSHIQVASSHCAKTMNHHQRCEEECKDGCSALLELKAVIAWSKKIGSRYKGSTKQQMVHMQMVNTRIKPSY